MLLSAHSHMPIVTFISVDDDSMIQACKNNTSLASALGAISKRGLVITHTQIARLFAPWVGEVDTSLFFLFLHGEKYILHPPTGTGKMRPGLDLKDALSFTCWLEDHGTNMSIRERRQKGHNDCGPLHFLGEMQTEFIKHLVSILRQSAVAGYVNRFCF